MRKLLWFTLGFAIAVAAGAYLLAPEVYFYVSGGCALILAACLFAMLRFPKARILAMVLLGCVVGFLWQTSFEACYLGIAREADGKTLTLTLTAADRSYETNYGAATECRATINGKSFQIWVYHQEEQTMMPGDTITGEFLLRCTLPGCGNESDYNRAKGIFLTAKPVGESVVSQSQAPKWWTYPARWRIAITDRMESIFPGDTVAFAKALLLGDTGDIDYATDTAFKISGIRHVIAVSGLHVSILFSLVYVFTARRKWLTTIVGLPLLFCFAALVGFSPSITRACVMHGLALIAMLFEREYDPPSALSFAVLCMLLSNPWTITNVGFQLSIGCVVGIFLFSEPIRLWLLDRKRLGRFGGRLGKLLKGLAAGISVSLGASVFTTALSAYYFGMVSLVSLLTNLLVLWVISFVFYGILLSLVASMIFAPLGMAIAWLLSWPIRYVLWVAKTLASFPMAAVYTASVYVVLWLIFCYLLLLLFLLFREKHPWLFGVCAALGLCVALTASWLEAERDDFRMTMLDVGQGQCILMQSDGKHYMIDCGGDIDRAAADQAVAFLMSQGISRLDGLILTHYDSDHAGGAEYLLQRIHCDVLFLPNSIDTNEVAQTLMSVADGKILRIDRDTEIAFCNTKISLFPSENWESDNESGLSILFQREDCDILITGDLSARGERELMEHIALPQLEVLVVGHHGSKYSTCRELLIITKPQIAMISAGADNFYGHPSAEVLQRLAQFGCLVLRTDLHGNLIYRG